MSRPPTPTPFTNPTPSPSGITGISRAELEEEIDMPGMTEELRNAFMRPFRVKTEK